MRRIINSILFSLWGYLFSVAHAGTSLISKFIEASQVTYYEGQGHITGRLEDRGDIELQQAVHHCEWMLALAIEVHTELKASNWQDIVPKYKSPREVEAMHEHVRINQVENHRIPFELMATDFAPSRFRGQTEEIYFDTKEIWVPTALHVFHHYPGQGPTFVESEDDWEHQTMGRRRDELYAKAYDAATRTMVEAFEKELPRHRKKIAVIRQPLYPMLWVFQNGPQLDVPYLATNALFDATQDPSGPRFNEKPEDFRSPVERVLQRASRGQEVLEKIDSIRAVNPHIPIFEWQNYILNFDDPDNQTLAAVQLQSWFIHQYLRHHANGYVLIHTMKESTTQIFEQRFRQFRSRGAPIYKVLKDSGDQEFAGEHVFVLPIRDAIMGLFDWQLQALRKLSTRLPGFAKLEEEFRARYIKDYRFYLNLPE